MKKALSIILSAVIFICSFSFSSNVFAHTKKEAPKVALGESFQVVQKAISLSKLKKINVDDLSETDFYCAKFLPQKTGYFEFVFDTDFSDTSDNATLFAYVFDKNEKSKANVMCIANGSSNDYSKLSLTSNPSMCTKLEKEKAYYLAIINVGKKTYNSNVVINAHTHELHEGKMRSYVNKSDLKKCCKGSRYVSCTKNGCDYFKATKSISRVKKITLSHPYYTYNGKYKRPIVTVRDYKGRKISKKNYKVKYLQNKVIGTAKVKITFKNDYEGSYTKAFHINPKKTSIQKLTAQRRGFSVKYRMRSKRITGYQIQYAADKEFSKNKKTLTVKGTKNTRLKVSYLNRRQKYYVRVRTYKVVNKKTYYSGWSKIKTVKTR